MKKRVLSIVLVVILVIMSIPITGQADNPYGPVTKRAFLLTAPYDGVINSIDFIGMSYLLQNFTSNASACTAYQQPSNGTLNSLHAQFNQRFGGSDNNDINYVYIASHGEYNGDLDINGNQTVYLSMLKLRQWLDGYDGHFIVMIDACHSGSAIGRGSENDADTIEEEPTAEEIAQTMMDAFLYCDEDPMRYGEFQNRSRYTVFCSCLSSQTSFTNTNPYSNPGGPFSYATYAWALGAGYDITTYQTTSQMADGYPNHNQNFIVTAKELYNYSLYKVNALVQQFNPYGRTAQTVCYYSASPYYSVFYNNTDHPLGDVTKDNAISMADVLKVRQYIAGEIGFDYTQERLADMNEDDSISMADVLAIQQYIAA